ncbi:MAG: cellulose synthase operon protein YhjQ [Alcaligenaceae bacterium]|nr:cellulose synthase operon protein YhjQ [Alcaligenaceae bacterium]
MKIIAIVSGKGGVGKTTVSANLCAGLRRLGKSVLAVDLDPQNALRLHFGVSPRHVGGLARAVLAGDDWRASVVQGNTGDYVLPYGSIDESDRLDFEQDLREDPNLLRTQLGLLGLAEDCIVVLDTPPGASVYLTQALSAANAAIVVALPDAASYATLPQIMSLMKQYCSRRKNFLGYLLLINQVDRVKQLADDVTDMMIAKFGKKSIALIHQDQAIPEALAYSKDLQDYDPLSRGAHDMKNCVEAVERLLNPALAGVAA